MASLLGLTPELVGMIFHHLDDESILVARGLNRYLKHSSMECFGKRFFREKGYMITSPGLQVLKSVAEHEQLAKYVKHVWFSYRCDDKSHSILLPEQHSDFNDAEDKDEEHRTTATRLSAHPQADGRGRRESVYTRYTKDHQQRLSRSEFPKRLTVVFSKLRNLRTVGIRDHQDHESHRRCWTDATMRLMPTFLLVAIIRAVAASDISLARLYTGMVSIELSHFRDVPQTVLNKALGSLSSLEAHVTMLRYMGWTGLSEDDADRKFLMGTNTLRELRLQCSPNLHPGRVVTMYRPRDWDVDNLFSRCFDSFVPSGTLVHLQKLSLEGITTNQSTLLGFLQNCPHSLQSLNLHSADLLQQQGLGTWKTAWKQWRPIFDHISTHLTELAAISVLVLFINGIRISFPGPYWADADIPTFDGRHLYGEEGVVRTLVITPRSAFSEHKFYTQGVQQVREILKALMENGETWWEGN